MSFLDIFKISEIKAENEKIKSENIKLQAKISELGVEE